ncbi:MAG: DUF2497 domain-containing protein [Alphaproteobacteria bacterium]|nr:DUF2497 domain-containing protein [Alphaproteobacteria bacterium]
MVTDDGSVVDLAEGKEPEAEMTTDTGEQQEETPEEAEQDTAMADENELTLQDGGQGEPQPAASEGGGTLVSPPVEAATTGSFEQLAKAVTKGDKPGTLLGSASDKTLEDIVKELLRPMLREWLDQNLPSITEKLVRKEIERAARRAEEL